MKFTDLQEETIHALDDSQSHLDDPEVSSWRHGPAVDYRVSNLVRHLPFANDYFLRVCAVAALNRDESFFQQVAYCFAYENKLPQPHRTIDDRTVTRAYQAAQKKMQDKRPPSMRGGLVLCEWIPTATGVAKEIDLLMETTGTTAAAVVDLCARKSLVLTLEKNDKIGRPKNK